MIRTLSRQNMGFPSPLPSEIRGNSQAFMQMQQCSSNAPGAVSPASSSCFPLSKWWLRDSEISNQFRQSEHLPRKLSPLLLFCFCNSILSRRKNPNWLLTCPSILLSWKNRSSGDKAGQPKGCLRQRPSRWLSLNPLCFSAPSLFPTPKRWVYQISSG